MANPTEIAEMQMQLALDACRAVDKPKFSAIAREFPLVNRQTLKRRFFREQESKAQSNSAHQQNLTAEQEEQLILHINMLTNHSLPLTSYIVRNLAKEMICRKVGKNWIGQFIQRHKDRLQSLYLRNINNMRTQAEYALLIKLFFNLVSSVLYCIHTL
jgi:hypothetical protein